LAEAVGPQLSHGTARWPRLAGRSWPIAASVLAFAIMVWPLWAVATPAMPDYPARLAGYYLAGGGATLSPFYGIAWMPVPNLAGEIAIPALGRVLTLEPATKVFLSLAVALWVWGPWLIHRALYGQWGVAPLISAFFAYNANFMWGFLNYYFAVGLCFAVFAGWIASENWPRLLRVAVFGAAITILYFSHLVAAILFLLLVATFEATNPRLTWRNVNRPFVDMAIISLPIVLLLLMKPGNSTDGKITFSIIDTLPARIESVVQTSFGEPATYLILVIALLFGLGMWRHKVFVHPRMHLPLIALALGALLMPERAMGGALAHLRLPAFAAAVLFASCDIRLSRPLKAVLVVAVFVGLAWLSLNLARQWTTYDRQALEFRFALANLPRGSRLMTAIGSRVPLSPLYWHIAEFAIIDRSAFSPQMFATKGQHIIYVKPEMAPFAPRAPIKGIPTHVKYLNKLAAGGSKNPKTQSFLCQRWPHLFYFPCHFDAVLVVHGKRKPQASVRMLRPIYAGSFFTLYEIRGPRVCASDQAPRPRCEQLPK